MPNNSGLKKIFQNGYMKTILIVGLTLLATGVFTYALQGYGSYTKDETDGKFMSKEMYETDQEYIKGELKDIKDTQKDIQKDIKELLKK